MKRGCLALLTSIFTGNHPTPLTVPLPVRGCTRGSCSSFTSEKLHTRYWYWSNLKKN